MRLFVPILTLFILAFSNTYAQLDSTLAPFLHGVASGDALNDRVIIWTRADHENLNDTIEVEWEVSEDQTFSSTVANGTLETFSAKDFTVKVDVTGLSSDTWYYYRFKYDGTSSPIGRTRTMPSAMVENLRFAVASCSNYGGGLWYNAYSDLATRTDIDAVIHLGDYIYEGGGSTSGVGVEVLPPNEIISLEDYRQRYASYRLDSNLRRVHQQWPFYTVWDDHESANNSWSDGAQAHDPITEGPWEVRLANAQQAYFEWLPIRPKEPNSYSIYRKVPLGPLADLIMIDTRIEGRDQEVGASDPAIDDPNRTILGEVQKQWLKDQLSNSTAQWKIIGNQVMFAPLELPVIPIIFPDGGIVNGDQWDGYRADREELIEHIHDNNIDNTVVLTGDIHTSWANDIPHHDLSYDPNNGAGSVGVEYVVTSITSGSSPVNIGAELISAANPHMKYIDLAQKGYLILDIDEQRVKGHWVYVSTVSEENYTTSESDAWVTIDGQNFLRSESALSSDEVKPVSADLGLSLYPNPVKTELNLQISCRLYSTLSYTVHDVSGRQINEISLGKSNAKTVISSYPVSGLAPGLYMIRLLNHQGESISKVFVKG